MLKDVLAEFESLGPVHALGCDAVPQSVKLECFVVKWPLIINAIHLFSDLATYHLFLTLLHGVGKPQMNAVSSSGKSSSSS